MKPVPGCAPDETSKRSGVRKIRVQDTTLRDAQQCLWATRMTTAMMLPVAQKMDAAGYEAIEDRKSVV